MHPLIKDTPTFPEMLDWLPFYSTKDLAHHLGVTERAVRNWKNAGVAPRPVMLAIYWHTHWGRHHVVQEAHREIAEYHRRAQAAELELDRLRAVVHKLEAQTVWQSSNGPLYKMG